MFSTFTKAFSLQFASRHVVRRSRPMTLSSSECFIQHPTQPRCRFMMSAAGGSNDETTVVSTCREKIQQALDAVDVQVTGTA